MTLSSLMLLVAVLSFGQEAITNRHLKFRESSFGNQFKFAQNNKQQLDSILHYSYEINSGELDDAYKEEFGYDANGNLIQAALFNWYESANRWLGLENEEYRYDVNGNLILHISYEWSESNSQWVEVRKHEYTYDASGNLLLDVNFTWDDSTNEWVLFQKYECTFDDDGNLLLDVD